MRDRIDEEGLLYQQPYIDSSPAYVSELGVYPSPFKHQINALVSDQVSRLRRLLGDRDNVFAKIFRQMIHKGHTLTASQQKEESPLNMTWPDLSQNSLKAFMFLTVKTQNLLRALKCRGRKHTP